MTQVWRSNPHFKIVVGSTTIEDDEAISIQVSRPENNLAYAVLTVNDYKSKNYIDVFDAFDTLKISFKYGSDSYTEVFSGFIYTTAPRLSEQGEVLGVSGWGKGIALLKTHCDTTYGVESQNPTLNTPKEILEDIVNSYVNDSYGDAAESTGWTIGNAQIDNVHAALSVTHLPGQYQNNFVMVNRVGDLVSAYAAGRGPAEASCHWYVLDGVLYVKNIDDDHSNGNWDHYWGGTSGADPGTQASSTIVVKEDMILYDFRKNVEEYANNIVLHTDFRKPGWDYWTEDADTNGLWDETDADMTITDDAVNYVVGADSLQFAAAANQLADGFYPTAAANWDFTKIGSENNPAHIVFYARREGNANHAVHLQLCTTDLTNYYYQQLFNTAASTHLMPTTSEWYHLRFPLVNARSFASPDGWSIIGNPDWTNIDFINIEINNTGFAGVSNFWLDDLHISGKIVREAKDTSEIAANKEHQLVLKNDTAIDDTMLSGTPGTTDTGMAASLAYSELLRRSQTPIVGMIQIPLAVDILPGQTVHIHACQKSDGTYRIDSDMRVKELTHVFTLPHPMTILNLTDDVMNTHAFGAPTAQSLLIEYAAALGHSEARDLKGGGIDPLVPRLTETY